VFFRDPGDPDWTVTNLNNVGLRPGTEAQSAAWNGFGWVVGTNLGLFRSATGQEPWARFDPALGSINLITFATQGRHLFAAFDTPLTVVIQESSDDGATWGNAETIPNVFVARLAVSGSLLYAARGDGLWRRAIVASAPSDGGAPPVRFALAGPGVARNEVPPEFGPYLAGLRRRIQELVVYPLAARRQGLAGRVEVEVVLEPTGRVRDVTMVASSTHPMLDDAALEAVRSLPPVPLPENLPRRPLRVRLPIIFDLR